MESFKNNIRNCSLENKDKIYLVVCTNYSDKNTYYLKDGKFAKNTCFNPSFDFLTNKVAFNTLKKDAIYKITEVNF